MSGSFVGKHKSRWLPLNHLKKRDQAGPVGLRSVETGSWWCWFWFLPPPADGLLEPHPFWALSWAAASVSNSAVIHFQLWINRQFAWRIRHLSLSLSGEITLPDRGAHSSPPVTWAHHSQNQLLRRARESPAPRCDILSIHIRAAAT